MGILESLLWENISYYDNYIDNLSDISQENIEDFSVSCLEVLRAYRDDDYNIQLICTGNKERINSDEIIINESESGSFISSGKICLQMFDGMEVVFYPCYCLGSSWTPSTNKIEFNLHCFKLEAKRSDKDTRIKKEWLLNGDLVGQLILGNNSYDYKVKSIASGEWGKSIFPKDHSVLERQNHGRYTHIKYKDSGFDISFVGSEYGPEWSTNICITYAKDYGRIPTEEERAFIRDYLSFFIGRKLIYTGETSFDDEGNISGFVMETPNSYGFGIKNICGKASKPPINNNFSRDCAFIDVLQQYIEPFEMVYNKLDLNLFFSSFWYAREVSQPFDLPILSGVLEYLQNHWYDKYEENPDKVLMNQEEFKCHLDNIIQIVKDEFVGTPLEERIDNSLEKINEMSVNARFKNFLKGVGITLNKDELKAVYARNKPAHGELEMGSEDYKKQIIQSNLYQGIIIRALLKLIGYDGKYIEYGIIGYPEKDIDG